MNSAGQILADALGVLNLLLILLVARKLRLAATRPPGPAQRPWLPPGAQLPPFEARTVDGQVVSLGRLRGKQSVVGFFSTSCEPCKQQVPLFVMQLTSEMAPDIGVAVIIGDGDDAEAFSRQLAGKALLVRETPHGALVRAFGARAFPAIYLLDTDGRVTASGPGIGAITGPRAGATAAPR